MQVHNEPKIVKLGWEEKNVVEKRGYMGYGILPFFEYSISRIFKGSTLIFRIFYLPTTKFSIILCASQLLYIYIYVHIFIYSSHLNPTDVPPNIFPPDTSNA